MDGSRIAFSLEPAESPISQALQRAYFAEIAGRYPGWSPDQISSAHPAEMAPPSGAWIIALLDDRPVGCGGIKRLDSGLAELRRIYLDESARGRGMGRLLLQHLEAKARELGYLRMRLDTGDRQPEALRLFRSAGYAEISAYNSHEWATHWMEKNVGEPPTLT